MAAEGVQGKQAEAAASIRNAQGGSSFDDGTSSDVVVRIVEGSEDGSKVENGGSLELHLHRNILIENSNFFAAQLSDRWEDACALDANGRPLLVVTYSGHFQECATALRKVYERAPGDPTKCPVHSFAGFEEAIQCLKPADQLCLSAVLSSAAAYLESIPWSDEQSEQLSKAIEHLGLSSAGVLKRMEPPSGLVTTELFTSVLSKALSMEAPNMYARLFVQKLLSEVKVSPGTQDKTAMELRAFVAASLRRCLSQMESNTIPNVRFEATYTYNRYAYQPNPNTPLTNLLSNLAWMFQLPQAWGSDDVRRDVMKTMLLIHAACKPAVYKEQVFHRFIAEILYLPVLKAVAEGTLIVGAERRVSLLKMWVPRRFACYNREEVQHVHSDAMQAAFNAVLGSVSYDDQKEVLLGWMDELMAASPWEPWFREWMKTCLLARWKKGSAGKHFAQSVLVGSYLPVLSPRSIKLVEVRFCSLVFLTAGQSSCKLLKYGPGTLPEKGCGGLHTTSQQL